MSESIQLMQSAGAGAQKSKVSSLESGNNSESADDPSGFTAVFASYVDSEPDASNQQLDQNLAAMLETLLPQTMLEDGNSLQMLEDGNSLQMLEAGNSLQMLEAGNSLPEDEKAVMWQALMLLQPVEKAITNTGVASQMQSINSLDTQRKPILNPSLVNQDYFETMSMQSKEGSTPLSIVMPHANQSQLLNMNEQFMPASTPTSIQGAPSSLLTGLAAVGFGTATQAATTQTQMAPLNLGQNAWETNLGSRLQMLIGQNIQTAEIRLDPPELGALEIKIKVTNDIASVNISSPHTQVREALETALPRLREMFEESGLSLGDVNVRQESFAQQQEQSEENQSSGLITDSTQGDEQQNLVSGKIISNNLLDIYA